MDFKGRLMIHFQLREYQKVHFEVLNQTCKSVHHFLINTVQERITDTFNNFRKYRPWHTSNPWSDSCCAKVDLSFDSFLEQVGFNAI